MNGYRKFFGVTALSVLMTGSAHSATIHVPDDHESIQQAVLAAAYGDTVLVAPGQYYEFIRMANGVTLKSAEGPENTTLVSPGLSDKPREERLLEVPAGCDENTRVEGFNMDSDNLGGCAVYVDSSTPEIRGNVMKSFGWGVHLNYADALLQDNLIEDSSAFGVLIRASSPRLFGNTVSGCAQQAISVTGKNSRPLIGGSYENRNRLFGNINSIVNLSKNDIDATYNDWGWETGAEMDRKGYPKDIVAIRDGNDEGKFHRGRGKVDYRHWVSAAVPVAEAAAAETDGGGDATAAADADGGDPEGGGGSPMPLVPLAVGVALILAFVVVARKVKG